MNQIIQNNQSQYPVNISTEEREGGLNLTELKDTLLRKLPLIAGCTLAFSCLGLIKVMTTPPNYVAGFELLSEPLNIETKVTSTDDASRETREQITSVDLDTVQLKILQSPRLISRVVETLQDKYPTLNYQQLISGLTIDIIANKNSKENILQVVYQDTDEQKVADVIDTIAQVYLDYSVEKRQLGVKRGIAFLDRQIPRISAQVKDTENQIQELRNQYNFINPDVSIDRINSRLNNLTQEEKEVESKLQELQLKVSDLERELNNSSTKSTTAIELANSQYVALIDRLQAIEVEIGRKSAIFSDRSIELQTLNEEKQEIIALIVEEEAVIRQKLTNQINALKNRQQTISTEIANFKIQLENWSEISRKYDNLQQDLNQANSKLSEFSRQKNALSIDAAQQETPWQILTPATEPKTDNVSAINYLLLSSTLGSLLGVGIALIVDKTQKIIYTSAKVEEMTNLPILATVPYSPNNKKRHIFPQVNSQTATLEVLPNRVQLSKQAEFFPDLVFPPIETFRSFAVNLGLLDFDDGSMSVNSDRKIESFVITSAIPREGKSTVALNLARASASLGKRVLLVDTDLRSKNSLTNSLNLGTEIGLWNLLQRDNYALESHFIQKIPLEKNLSILTSGFDETQSENASSDPGGLLASVNMQLLMEEFKSHFDLVIYDFCSIIGFADVNLLASKTDGIVLVTGLGKLQSIALTEALNQLVLCKAPVLGVVVNKVVNSVAKTTS